MKKIFYLLAAALMGVPSLMAEDVTFTYAPETGTIANIGRGRLVDNDCAILLKDPGYVGYEVLGISVNVPYLDGCECDPNAKAWLAHELVVDQETYKCVPDLVTEGTIVNHGTAENPDYRLDITFSEPYKLTSEGIYVGYTLTVTKLKNSTAKYPLQIITSPNPQNGLFVHFGMSAGNLNNPLAYNKEFQDFSVSNGAVSTMRVYLRGQKIENSVSVTCPANLYGVMGATQPIDAVVSNYGTDEIKDISYVISADGVAEQSGTLTLSTPIACQSNANVPIPFIVPEQKGDYNYKLEITTVNGNENMNADRTFGFTAYSRPWIPKKRVLVEEYTGLWCGTCPGAYVGLKQLNDKRADDIIILTYHKADSMQTIDTSDMPNTKTGAPIVDLDRTASPSSFQFLENDVDKCLDELAPAEISVDLYWSDNNKNQLRAVSHVHFLDDTEADRYRLAYAMVEDDMSDPTWIQTNNFYSADNPDYQTGWYTTEYWDLFIGKGMQVPGIVYDDVTLYFPNCFGIPNSIPAVSADEQISHSGFLALDKAVGVYNQGAGRNMIKDRKKLRAVAVLIDSKTGKVANAATSCYAADIPVYDDVIDGVDSINADNGAQVVGTEYYDLSGVRLAECPRNGVVIVVRRYADGSVKTAKLVQ